MSNRYQVFGEDINGETHWGIYDSATGEVLEWFATEQEATNHVPEED